MIGADLFLKSARGTGRSPVLPSSANPAKPDLQLNQCFFDYKTKKSVPMEVSGQIFYFFTGKNQNRHFNRLRLHMVFNSVENSVESVEKDV